MQYKINTLDQLRPILIGYRKLKKLSQKDMANLLDITQQAYQAIESKPERTTVERLYKVLNILGVKIQLLKTHTNQQVSSTSEYQINEPTPTYQKDINTINDKDEW